MKIVKHAQLDFYNTAVWLDYMRRNYLKTNETNIVNKRSNAVTTKRNAMLHPIHNTCKIQ